MTVGTCILTIFPPKLHLSLPCISESITPGAKSYYGIQTLSGLPRSLSQALGSRIKLEVSCLPDGGRTS